MRIQSFVAVRVVVGLGTHCCKARDRCEVAGSLLPSGIVVVDPVAVVIGSAAVGFAAAECAVAVA